MEEKKKNNKRTLILLGVLGAVVAYAVPNVILNNSETPAQTSIQTPTQTAQVETKNVENTANASQTSNKGVSVNSDKLNIEKLTSSPYQLRTNKAEAHPFRAVNAVKQTPSNTTINNTSQKPMNNPSTIPIGNVMAKPNGALPATPQMKDTNMKLLAIAQTGSKIIAVIEVEGKRTSAFIGTSIGDYTVTDIDSNHVYLQGNSGMTKVLDLVK